MQFQIVLSGTSIVTTGCGRTNFTQNQTKGGVELEFNFNFIAFPNAYKSEFMYKMRKQYTHLHIVDTSSVDILLAIEKSRMFWVTTLEQEQEGVSTLTYSYL